MSFAPADPGRSSARPPRVPPLARRIGLTLIGAPPIVLLIVVLVLREWLRQRAAESPVPDQGAMVVAYLTTVATATFGAVVMIVGAVVLFVNRSGKGRACQLPHH